jgi:hypothetical protein
MGNETMNTILDGNTANPKVTLSMMPPELC